MFLYNRNGLVALMRESPFAIRTARVLVKGVTDMKTNAIIRLEDSTEAAEDRLVRRLHGFLG